MATVLFPENVPVHLKIFVFFSIFFFSDGLFQHHIMAVSTGVAGRKSTPRNYPVDE